MEDWSRCDGGARAHVRPVWDRNTRTSVKKKKRPPRLPWPDLLVSPRRKVPLPLPIPSLRSARAELNKTINYGDRHKRMTKSHDSIAAPWGKIILIGNIQSHLAMSDGKSRTR